MSATTERPSVKVTPFSYAELGKTPEGYKCGCGKTGVKLWREYNTFLDYQTLYCIDCGRAGGEEEYAYLLKPITATEWGETDHITHPKQGSLVPAIPTEDGNTYWGYTSVPAMGCIWWRSLAQPDWTDEVLLRDFKDNLDYEKTWVEFMNKAEKRRLTRRTEYLRALHRPNVSPSLRIEYVIALRQDRKRARSIRKHTGLGQKRYDKKQRAEYYGRLLYETRLGLNILRKELTRRGIKA